MNKAIEREKFEVWAKNNNYDPSFDGKRYFDDRTEVAWAGWQAALTLSTPLGDSKEWIRADNVNKLVRKLDALLNGEQEAGSKAGLGELVNRLPR